MPVSFAAPVLSVIVHADSVTASPEESATELHAFRSAESDGTDGLFFFDI